MKTLTRVVFFLIHGIRPAREAMSDIDAISLLSRTRQVLAQGTNAICLNYLLLPTAGQQRNL